MKKFIKPAWIICCLLLLLLFIISCFSSYVAPASFSYMPLFALMFPWLFMATLICACINFYAAKKLALVMFICLLPGLLNLFNIVAFNLPQQTDNNKSDSLLRIMTWNVQDFVSLTEKSEIRSKMLRLISEKNPDILCVQECLNVEGGKRISVRKELNSLGYSYYFFSNDQHFINRQGAEVKKGVAIFSKKPLIDSGRISIRSEGEKENLVYADINFEGRPLRIYTAHLASFELFTDTNDINKDLYKITYDRKKEIQYKLRETEQLHQEEIKIIRKAISNTNLPVIYCGDMNTVPTTYTYRYLKNDLQDAFLAKGFGFGATFYKILPLLRIDYCLADKRLNVLNCVVINQKLSDHYPVITDMQWK